MFGDIIYSICGLVIYIYIIILRYTTLFFLQSYQIHHWSQVHQKSIIQAHHCHHLHPKKISWNLKIVKNKYTPCNEQPTSFKKQQTAKRNNGHRPASDFQGFFLLLVPRRCAGCCDDFLRLPAKTSPKEGVDHYHHFF